MEREGADRRDKKTHTQAKKRARGVLQNSARRQSAGLKTHLAA